MSLLARLTDGRRSGPATAGAVLCGLLLALTGCQIARPRPADPLPPLPADFAGAATPDSAARLRVEEFFTDPALVGLITRAVENNQQLKILTQDIGIANTEVLLRRGLLFPFVTTRLGVGVDRHSKYTLEGQVEEQLEYRPGRHFPRGLPDFLVAANVSWQVDIWRKLRNARDAAVQRYFATAEGRNYAVTRLVADVAENYYGLLALDNRLTVLEETIAVQQQSLKIAEARLAAPRLEPGARTTALSVQRFQADIARFQSERLVVRQEIVERENRINFLLGRFPQPVERTAAGFLDLSAGPVAVGVPAQLLLNRPDVRQAEREVAAAGLEVKVARAEFFPSLDLTGGLGFRAFSPEFLFNPESFIANAAGELVAPLVNRTAIQAAYNGATARQLRAVYEYQRVVLDAYTEVVNRVSAVQNYGRSIEIRRQQLEVLRTSVATANDLLQNARADYIEVLTAQRDLLEARTAVLDLKRQQLVAVVNAYQALGGGGYLAPPIPAPGTVDRPGRGGHGGPPAPAGPPAAPPPAPPLLLPEPPPLLPAPRELKDPFAPPAVLPPVPGLPKGKDAPAAPPPAPPAPPPAPRKE